MKNFCNLLCLTSLALTLTSNHTAVASPKESRRDPVNEWSKVTTPTTGKSEAIGFYDSGCIAGARRLAPIGVGYQTVRPVRNRHYGHPELIDFIEGLARTMHAKGSGILVCDMGQPRGGPLPSGHASHQMGLDTDIWFWTHPEQRKRTLTEKERNALPFISMLNAQKTTVNTDKFKDEQIQKLRMAAADPRSERIFVNPAIKNYLCMTLPKTDQEWLHKLRPWPGHHEHFHVRLKCPEDSLKCKHQDAVPEGSGCKEAQEEYETYLKELLAPHKEEHRQEKDEKKSEVPLPPECTDVLKQ